MESSPIDRVQKNLALRTINTMSKVGGYAAAIVLLCMIFLIMTEVVSRYIMRNAINFGEEYSAYALVAIAFLGMAYTMYRGAHIRVDFLVKMINKKVADVLRLISLVLSLGWCVLASIVCVQFDYQSFERGIASTNITVTPLGWPQMAIPIGFILLSFSLVVKIVQTVALMKMGYNVEHMTLEEQASITEES